MKYFNQIPNIFYSLDDDNIDVKLTKNILTRVRMIREVMENSNIYYDYIMKDSDKPEIIAHKMYNNTERHWIIMMGNDIYDPYYDFPVSINVLDQYIIKKYGSIEIAMSQIHHYEKRIVVNSTINGYTESVTYTTELTEQSYNDQTGQLEDNTLPTIGTPIIKVGYTDAVVIDGVSISTETYHVAINSYDYELSQNENKRKIKIAKPEVITSIEKNLVNLVG